MDSRELILRKSIPVFINSYNQPKYLENIIQNFKKNQFSNINVIDSCSTLAIMAPVYEMLAKSGVHIFYYPSNLGPRHFQLSGLHKLTGGIPHIYTDPDINFSTLANNFLSRLLDLSKKYQVAKVGSALDISESIEFKNMEIKVDHIPNQSFKIREWESQFWKNKIEEHVYLAGIDTTLHLFNPQYFKQNDFFSGIRVAEKGFLVEHLPWHKNNFIVGVDDENAYRSTAHYSNWA
jgi:hypothetical protein